MPYKKGGGDQLQFYDENNGQYDEETRFKMNEADKEALVLAHYFSMPYGELRFHFPVYGVHDDDYCRIFVLYARTRIEGLAIDSRKATYLLTPRPKDDKSSFLMGIGYSAEKQDELISDIHNYTEIRSLTFSRMDDKCCKCEAKTILKGKITTTIWALEKNFQIRFITLIPGGDKRWK